MPNKIPIRLKKEPLLEAIWEIRFSGGNVPVADLLPGMLFRVFAQKYGKAYKLPAAAIPAAVAEQDPVLRYAPKIRLDGTNQTVQIGDYMVSLSCLCPYCGWAKFSHDIRELAEAVRETGLVQRSERFSLKYIDLVELEEPVGLAHLNLVLNLAGHGLVANPVQLRRQIHENDLIHIVQITSPAEVVLSETETRLKGVLVDIDSIKNMEPSDSWETLYKRLDDVHSSCKKMFFSILKPQTLERLEPEY